MSNCSVPQNTCNIQRSLVYKMIRLIKNETDSGKIITWEKILQVLNASLIIQCSNISYILRQREYSLIKKSLGFLVHKMIRLLKNENVKNNYM